MLKVVRNSESLRLTFTLHLTESTSVEWETVVWRHCLYIRVPSCLLPEGSKEGFVTLLEYAEETLRCMNIIVCLRKDRADRGTWYLLLLSYYYLCQTEFFIQDTFVLWFSNAGSYIHVLGIQCSTTNSCLGTTW